MVRADAPVAGEELERLAHDYRHLRAEHRRTRLGSRARRRLDARVRAVGERFERLLAEAALDEDARERWRDRLRGGAEPEGPGQSRPLLFRGRSETGSELLLLARPDGSIDAVVDGTTVERLDSAAELDATEPGQRFQLEGLVYRETFAASAPARAALRESLEGGVPPAADAVAELLADGIVDRDLAVTPRGRRALALDVLPAQRTTPPPEASVSVRVRGEVGPQARDDLEQALLRAAALAARPPVRAQASLVRDADPALERPFVAHAELDLGGRVVRAHVAATSAAEAVDAVDARLRRSLAELAERAEAARREGRPARPGAWRHGDLPTHRPRVAEREPEERRIVRRASFAAEPMSVEEAAWEMRLLDHDFHLFTDADSGVEEVVYVREDGSLGLKQPDGGGAYVEPAQSDPEPAPTLTTEAAVERLNASHEPFVFFLDATSGRGAVLYRRYDGHYGLVSAPG